MMLWRATVLLWLLGAPLWAQEPHGGVAEFGDPTPRYDHGVLGDSIEYGALVFENRQARAVLTLPETRVFEDITPRLADITGDGLTEIIVVETDMARGATLAVYRAVFPARSGAVHLEKLAATDPIGQPYRWLAPAGFGDFNRDGQLDIAYIETPHLGKTLRIVTYSHGALVEIGALAGLSNHRIGDGYISGGVRDCGNGAEVISADGAWQHVMATRMEAGRLVSRVLGAYRRPSDLRRALACS